MTDQNGSHRVEDEGGPVRPGALSALLQQLYASGDASGGRWPAALKPGDVVGRFELLREAGRGGFGVVYEARDRELGRTVAFKVLLPGAGPDTCEERLLREAEAAARLSHPNIVTIHDVGRSESGPYLILELLHGVTLAKRLELGPVPLREAVRVGLDVARGLAHAHEQGVFHRDLTPGNVFLCEDGQVKVLDLGMAHAFGRSMLDGGTPAYMAPEQWSGAPEDERTDVFALGVVIYEMLTGELPFPRDHGGEGLPGWRAAPALSIPEAPGLADLVAAMLQKDPVRRPRDAGEVLAALRIFDQELQRSAGAVRTSRVRIEAPARPRWRAALALLAIAALGAVVAAAALTNRLRPHGGPERPGATGTIPSIAVLPFVDMSPGKDQGYFADGIAEEILNALANIEGLQVPGRTSSFYFKDKNVTISDIGHELKVSTVLEGSVRKEGNRVRVTAQVVDVTGGYHLWSEIYDRELTGIFAVQGEIARAVVEALKVKVFPGAPGVKQHRETNPDAYNAYLLGLHFFDLGTPDGMSRAVAELEKALAIDPGYAPAWAWLSVSLLNAKVYLARGLSPAEVDEAAERATAAADRAVALAPDLANCWSARGWMRTSLSWDWGGARADFDRALALNPRDTNILLRKSHLLYVTGDVQEALATIRKVIEIDPLYAWGWTFLAMYQNGAGQPELGRQAATRALEISPEHFYAMTQLGISYLVLGQPRDALAIFERHRGEVLHLMGTALAQHDLGHVAEEQRALDALRARFADRDAYAIALVYAWRGDRDRAFEWMDRAVTQHGGRGYSRLLIRDIKHDPLLRKIRDDPRYTALLKRMGLPPA